MSTHINPLNALPESFDKKNKLKKNLKVQFLTNQMIKD
jgi:hypothetical protein